MKSLKKININNPKDRFETIMSYSEKIKGIQDSKKEERQVLELLEKTSDPESMAVAIEIAAKGKMVNSVSLLYDLLRSPTANTLNPKWMDPPAALLQIGKEGLPALIESLKADTPDNIPYQIIANILYNWFDHDRQSLRDFLLNQVEESDSKDQSKFRALIGIVDNWKSE